MVTHRARAGVRLAESEVELLLRSTRTLNAGIDTELERLKAEVKSIGIPSSEHEDLYLQYLHDQGSLIRQNVANTLRSSAVVNLYTVIEKLLVRLSVNYHTSRSDDQWKPSSNRVRAGVRWLHQLICGLIGCGKPRHSRSVSDPNRFNLDDAR